MPDQVPRELTVYCNCMDRMKYHLILIQETLAGNIVNLQQQDVLAEVIYLHFRKALEEIAFASLAANREKYAEARAGYATEWNARRMLGFIEKVNPNFYPVPIKPIERINGQLTPAEPMDKPYLTRADFETLYDAGSEILHSRNPFSNEPETISVHYTVEEWMDLIGRLTGWHYMQIPDLRGIWLIQVPSDAPPHAWLAMADDPPIVEQ